MFFNYSSGVFLLRSPSTFSGIMSWVYAKRCSCNDKKRERGINQIGWEVIDSIYDVSVISNATTVSESCREVESQQSLTEMLISLMTSDDAIVEISEKISIIRTNHDLLSLVVIDFARGDWLGILSDTSSSHCGELLCGGMADFSKWMVSYDGERERQMTSMTIFQVQ